MLSRRAWLAALAGAGLAALLPAARATPALMLAGVYRRGMPLEDYWVSEKYDGVRGYWDGHQLWARGGERIAAPAWFTAGLPTTPLDGELWAGRGRFEQTLATVRAQMPDDKAWREIRFMAFDLPAQPGDFNARLVALQRLLPLPNAPWLVAVPQQRATTHEELQALLHKTVKLGGEGLMLHRGRSFYRGERGSDLLKLKPFDDAEARVIAHLPGQGRHAGRLGALQVESAEGRAFRLDSGFTEAQRREPPAIGSWVTYRFNGTTADGLPRAARFLRVFTG